MGPLIHTQGIDQHVRLLQSQGLVRRYQGKHRADCVVCTRWSGTQEGAYCLDCGRVYVHPTV